MKQIDMKVSGSGAVEYNYYSSVYAVCSVVLKAILTMLFSFLFMVTVSADTGTIEGSIAHTSMANGTVTVYPDGGGKDTEVINHVPLTVIEDINNQRDAPFGVKYVYTFTVQSQGRYQDYTYTKHDGRVVICAYFIVAFFFVTLFLLKMIFKKDH